MIGVGLVLTIPAPTRPASLGLVLGGMVVFMIGSAMT